MNKLVENVDYYLENDVLVMTEYFHEKRGFCCGNKCRHCAYEPRHIKNNTKLRVNSSKIQ